MRPTELKMQPTIHLQSKPCYYPRRHPDLVWKCIVGSIFNSVGLIIVKYLVYTGCPKIAEQLSGAITTHVRKL
jgi:hypothetical protein